MRTVNGLERVNGELLRLVSALAAEISEEWETGRAYLAPSAEAANIGSRGCPRSDDRDPPRSTGTPHTEQHEDPS
jgi:hypothetical protein